MTTTPYLTSAPPWIRRVAELAAFAPVPSSLWRLPLIVGFAMGLSDQIMDEVMSQPFAVRAAYLIGLGVLSDGCAYLTLGLVRPWGEVFPGWIPRLGGRRVSGWFVVPLATAGGLGACAFGIPFVLNWKDFLALPAGWDVLMALCYLPLACWGPAVLVVTVDHARRRRLARHAAGVTDRSPAAVGTMST